MIIIPALELAGGAIVKTGSDKAVKDGQTALVKKLAKQGAVYFHLEDRDGENSEVIQGFVEQVVAFQLGGPRCKPGTVREMLDSGADRVVVTADELETKELESLAKDFGVRVLAEVVLAEDPEKQLAALAGTGLRQAVLKPEGGKVAEPDALGAALEKTDLDVYLWTTVKNQEDFAVLRKMVGAGLLGAIVSHEQCVKLVELAQAASSSA